MNMPSFKKYKIAAVLAAAALLLILTTKAKSMFTVYVFSEVKGQVISGGKPVAGATVVRSFHWRWGNKKGQDETKTNGSGEFAFPAIKKIMLLGSLLPHEPYIGQIITIKRGGDVYEAWNADKRDYELNGEITEIVNGKPRNKPMDLLCDLGVEAEFKQRGIDRYFGIATLR